MDHCLQWYRRSQFPEKSFPRRFDLCGASHQLMHIMVLLAAIAYTIGVMEAFEERTKCSDRA